MESNARNYHWVVFLKGGTRFLWKGAKFLRAYFLQKIVQFLGIVVPFSKN